LLDAALKFKHYYFAIHLKFVVYDLSTIILETNLMLTNHSSIAAITAKMSDLIADVIPKVHKLAANQCSYYSTLP
jgi:hypothetical protein